MLVLGIFMFPSLAQAVPPDFNGGVNNEYEYEEIVFVSGEPVRFVGEMKVSEKEKGDTKAIKYTFKLKAADSSIDAKLDRKVNYDITYDRRTEKGQTIANTELGSYKETITFGKDKYSLEDYQFSKSDIVDNRPASDFYSGTIKGRRYYTLNKDEGKVIIDISGGDVGYENFWGSTETQILDYYIQSEGLDDIGKLIYWEGTVKAYVSDSTRKKLRYVDNEAGYSSFDGGNMRVTEQERYSRYEYDLPKVKLVGEELVPDGNKRNRHNEEIKKEMLPQVERLILPKFRDTGGHWGENAINKLFSLDVFTGNLQFFVPDVPMSRMDFTRAVIKSCDIRVGDEGKKKTRTRQKNVEISPFEDVSVNDTDYEYVKFAVDKGLISGVSPGLFGKEEPLTRAQAINILMRALGFENQVPTPGYITQFTDDYKIPAWARDAIYAAREIGLVQGDALNRINADQKMTRAEASALLVKFLEFMQDDLQKDYREHIILYN